MSVTASQRADPLALDPQALQAPDAVQVPVDVDAAAHIFTETMQGRRFTHIVHLADVHLRVGDMASSRAAEYEHVFGNLDTMLGQLPAIAHGAALIAVCGDIFHSKSRADTPTVRLWTRLVALLTRHAPTVLIAGNHDFRQEDPRLPDLIEVHLEHWTPAGHPCVYLASRTPLRAGNLMLATVPVKETLRVADSRAFVAHQPDFPPADRLRAHPGVDAAVALFHGTLGQTALPGGGGASGGNRASWTYALDAFAGYDLVLLGDNHQQQLGPQGARWGYPGSLVQQTAGENLLEHGFLLWDVARRTATAHHVPNDHAIVRLSYDAATRLVHVHRLAATLPASLPLAAALDELARRSLPFPRQPRVDFVGSADAERDVCDQLWRLAGARPSQLVRRRGPEAAHLPGLGRLGPGATHTALDSLAEFNRPARWLEYVRERDAGLADRLVRRGWWPDHLDGPAVRDLHLLPPDPTPEQRRLLPEFAAWLQDRRAHADLGQHLAALTASLAADPQRRLPVTLRHMRWSWTFGYGPDNYFDFDAADGQVAIVNGPNAIGKSAFLDTICLGLFGETGSNRHQGADGVVQTSQDYIHRACPPTATASVDLAMTIGGVDYLLKRTLRRARGTQRVEADASVRTLATVVAQGVRMVNGWVRDQVGAIADMLRTTLVAQLDRDNFFTADAADQVRLVDDALNLGNVTGFSLFLHQACNGYQYLVNKADAALQVMRRQLAQLGGPADADAVEDTDVDGAMGAWRVDDRALQALRDRQGQIERELLRLSAERDNAAADAGTGLRTPSGGTAAEALGELEGAVRRARKALLAAGEAEAHLRPEAIERHVGTVDADFEHAGGEDTAARSPGTPDAALHARREALDAALDALRSRAGAAPPPPDPTFLVAALAAPCAACGVTAPDTVAAVAPCVAHARSARQALLEAREALLDRPAGGEAWRGQVDQLNQRIERLSELVGRLDLVAEAARAHDGRAAVDSEVAALEAEAAELEATLAARRACQRAAHVHTYRNALRALVLARQQAAAQRHRALVTQIDALTTEDGEVGHALAAAAVDDGAMRQRREAAAQVAAGTRLLAEWQAAKDDCDALYACFGAQATRNSRGAARGALHADTYKSWVYTHGVLPILSAEVNQFLESVEPTLTLEIAYANAQFTVHVQQANGARTAYFSSSGYQQFVVGLAMRHALTALGRTGTRLRHLLVDEGFTACDRTNLLKAGDMLRQLLQTGLYHSIVVVSHLDAVRDEIEAPYQASIERVHGHAVLRFGAAAPPVLDGGNRVGNADPAAALASYGGVTPWRPPTLAEGRQRAAPAAAGPGRGTVRGRRAGLRTPAAAPVPPAPSPGPPSAATAGRPRPLDGSIVSQLPGLSQGSATVGFVRQVASAASFSRGSPAAAQGAPPSFLASAAPFGGALVEHARQLSPSGVRFFTRPRPGDEQEGPPLAQRRRLAGSGTDVVNTIPVIELD